MSRTRSTRGTSSTSGTSSSSRSTKRGCKSKLQLVPLHAARYFLCVTTAACVFAAALRTFESTKKQAQRSMSEPFKSIVFGTYFFYI